MTYKTKNKVTCPYCGVSIHIGWVLPPVNLKDNYNICYKCHNTYLFSVEPIVDTNLYYVTYVRKTDIENSDKILKQVSVQDTMENELIREYPKKII